MGATANVLPGYGGCASEWASYFRYIAAAWPDARLSLLSALDDEQINHSPSWPKLRP